MGKPSAPAAPNYAAAATAQGSANTQTAIANNQLNQDNQVTPYGSLTYQYSQPGSGQGYTDSNGNYIPQATATTSLSPQEQQLFNQNTSLQTGLNSAALGTMGDVTAAASQPLTASQFNPVQQSLGSTGLAINGSVAPTTTSAINPADYTANANAVTQAMLTQMAPSQQQQQEQLQAQLANQGIQGGSEAAGYANTQLASNQAQQKAAAVVAGQQQAQSQIQDALQTQNQNFSQNLSNASLGNTAQAQQYNQGLSSGQFANQAQQQAIQEGAYFQTEPLNTLNALRSGNQVQNPTFTNVSAGSTAQAAPVFSAAQSQYSAALQQYQTQMNQFNGMMQGLGGIAPSIAMGV